MHVVIYIADSFIPDKESGDGTDERSWLYGMPFVAKLLDDINPKICEARTILRVAKIKIILCKVCRTILCIANCKLHQASQHETRHYVHILQGQDIDIIYYF